MKHVVIVGGGFSGVRLARKLRNKRDIEVTLVNDGLDFKYCPALYRAAAGYKMGTARLSIEWMLLDAGNVDLVEGKAVDINPAKKNISLESGETLGYDYAVFGIGSENTFFNIEGLHEHGFGMKTPNEIIQLRQHLHDKLKNHDREQANYVIIGAGPTGVELAGALGDYLRRIARKYGNHHHKINIWLVEAADRILPRSTEKTSNAAAKRLMKLGIKILTSTKVEKETLSELHTNNGILKTDTVIWTAGAKLNSFFEDNDDVFDINERHLVKVNKRLEALENVYVIGDSSSATNGLALGAIWNANFVAKDLLRRTKKKPRKAYKDHKPISVIPCGKNWAVAEYSGITISGYIASRLRKIADFVGYMDIMGPLRALTIWTNTDQLEDQ